MGKGEENNPQSGLCVPFLYTELYFSETILLCVSNEELNLAANEERTRVAMCGYLRICNRSAF